MQIRIVSIYDNILKDIVKPSIKSKFKDEFKKFLLSGRDSDELCEEINKVITEIQHIVQNSVLDIVKIEDFNYQFEILKNMMRHIQNNHNPGIFDIKEKMNMLKVNAISNDFIINKLLKYFKESN